MALICRSTKPTHGLALVLLDAAAFAIAHTHFVLRRGEAFRSRLVLKHGGEDGERQRSACGAGRGELLGSGGTVGRRANPLVARWLHDFVDQHKTLDPQLLTSRQSAEASRLNSPRLRGRSSLDQDSPRAAMAFETLCHLLKARLYLTHGA